MQNILSAWARATTTSAPYFPEIAKALGSPLAALILPVLVGHSDENGRILVAVDVITRRRLGLSTGQFGSAIKSLCKSGLINDPDSDGLRLDLAELGEFLGRLSSAPAAPMRARKPRQTSLPSPLPSRAELIDGRCDQRSGDDATVQGLFALWRECWAVGAASRLTASRRAEYRKALREGQTASAYARAIIGMTFDPWEERKNYREWSSVTKHVDKWVRLYEQVASGEIEKREVLPFKTKVVDGVTYRAEYSIAQEDEQCRRDGWRFDPRADKWHRPGSEGFAALAQFNKRGSK